MPNDGRNLAVAPSKRYRTMANLEHDIAKLNATHSTPPQSPSRLLPASGQGVRGEVCYVNVQVVRNAHLQMACTVFSGYGSYLQCL